MPLAQHMRKNQYEEALFRCEDDRYELDMVIETNSSTIRAIKPLCEDIMKMNPEEKANYRVPEGVMSPVHYRCIQKIYGERWLPACVHARHVRSSWLVLANVCF